MWEWLLNLLASLFGPQRGAILPAEAGVPSAPSTETASPEARSAPVELDELLAAGVARTTAMLYLPHLNAAMRVYDIVTPLRVAHFLSQVLWESSHLTRLREVGALDGNIWQGYGAIQLTGEWNQTTCWQHCMPGIPFDRIACQTWLQTPSGGTLSAAWFWGLRNCNAAADRDDVIAVTKLINGGDNGLAGRQAILDAVKKEMDLL